MKSVAETAQPEADAPLDRAEWHGGELGNVLVGEFSEERQLDRGWVLGGSAISAAPERRASAAMVSGADR